MSEILLLIMPTLLAVLSGILFISAALVAIYIFRQPLPENSIFNYKKLMFLAGTLAWIGTFVAGLGPLIYINLSLTSLVFLLIAGFLFAIFFTGNLFYIQFLRAKAMGK